jgi:hypothetical protein
MPENNTVTRIRPTRKPLPPPTQDALSEIGTTVSTARAILEYVSEALVTEPALIHAGEAGSRAMLAVDAVIVMLRPIATQLERVGAGVPVSVLQEEPT